MIQDFSRLLSLLGEGTSSNEWHQLQTSCSSSVVEQLGPELTQYSYRAEGIRIILMDEVVSELWFYGSGEPNFASFKSTIMDSIFLTDSRSEVRDRLGAPRSRCLRFPGVPQPETNSKDDWRRYLSQPNVQSPEFIVDGYLWGRYSIEFFFDAGEESLSHVRISLFEEPDEIETLIADEPCAVDRQCLSKIDHPRRYHLRYHRIL